VREDVVRRDPASVQALEPVLVGRGESENVAVEF